MGLKRKSNGALLRHDDGALMNDCCCTPEPYECVVDAALMTANKLITDTPYVNRACYMYDSALTCIRPSTVRSGNLGALTQYDWSSMSGQLCSTPQYLGYWWFGDRKLMDVGTYQVEYLGGAPLIKVNNVGNWYFPNINFYDAGLSVIDPISRLAFAAVVLPCDAGTPSIHYFPGVCDSSQLASVQTWHTQDINPAQTAILNAQAASGFMTITLAKPAFIGITFLAQCAGAFWNCQNWCIAMGNGGYDNAGNVFTASVGYWPRYKLHSCNPCLPKSPINAAYNNTQTSSQFGTFSWENQTGCYDRHVIYLKSIASDSECVSTSDPSNGASVTLVKDGVVSCDDVAPISNSHLPEIALSQGKYCARIDAQITHTTWVETLSPLGNVKIVTGSALTTETKTAKGTPFIIDVTCPNQPEIEILTPADGTKLSGPWSDDSYIAYPMVKIRYRYCSSVQVVNTTQPYGYLINLTNAYSAESVEVEVRSFLVKCGNSPDYAQNVFEAIGSNNCGRVRNVSNYYASLIEPVTPPVDPVVDPTKPVICGGCASGLAATYSVTMSGGSLPQAERGLVTVTYKPQFSSATKCFYRGTKGLGDTNVQTVDLVLENGAWYVREAPFGVEWRNVSNSICSPSGGSSNSYNYQTGEPTSQPISVSVSS
jgi:hypothetical protein